MKTKQINLWQLFIIMMVCGTALKMFMIHNFILENGGRDAWISLIISYLCAAAGVAAVLWAMRIAPEKDAYTILSDAFGKIAAKIIMLFLTLMLLFNTLWGLVENDVMYAKNYTFLSHGFFNFALLIIIGYMARKGLKAIARTAEVLAPILFLVLLLLLIKMAVNTSYEKILPILEQGISLPAKSFIKSPVAFGDLSIIIFLMGKIKGGKKIALSGGLAAAAVITTILIGMFAYISTFSDIRLLSRYNFSISDVLSIDKMSKETVSFFSIFFSMFWLLAVMLKLAVYIKVATDSLAQCLNIKKDFILLAILLVGLFVCGEVFSGKQDTIRVFAMDYLGYFGMAAYYLMPFIFPIAAAVGNKKSKNLPDIQYNQGQKVEGE